jgi:hypothetical protein
MREWLIITTTTAVVIIDWMALVIVLIGTPMRLLSASPGLLRAGRGS